MLAFTGGFPRRAHRIVGVVVVAGAITVAVHGGAEALPDALVDLPIQISAQRHVVDLEQALGSIRRRTDLPGVELIVRVERALERLQCRVQLAKKPGDVFRTQTLAVLAP
ncbi:hypothetical protein D3C71_1618550 [compost metagenome]